MRKFCTILAAGVGLATIAIPQAAFATDHAAAQRYAYQKCTGETGFDWIDMGFSSFNECTHYYIQEYEINNP